ncbi:MAG: polysaccharide biosynthesis/export family protein [Veillonellales bacterium]
MNRLAKIVLLILITMMGCGASASAQDYQLGAGDVLGIGVWGYDEFQNKEPIIVRPDGKIAFPLLGEVEVAGRSPAEVSDILTAGLSHYINTPHVTVNVMRFRTTRVYVLGEVEKPGMYEIEKQHNLLDAIGMAGGYTKDAAKKKVLIIRRDKSGQPVVANVLNLVSKGDLSQNYALNEGDIVYLASNGRIDLLRDILPVISIVYQVHQFDD